MKSNDPFDPDRFHRELSAFIELGDSLFEEGSEARTLSGYSACDLLEGTRIVPGPADESGRSPVYMVKFSDHAPAMPVAIETDSAPGVPETALAVILMHRLQQSAGGPEATAVDTGAARAMGRVLQWLGVKATVNRLME